MSVTLCVYVLLQLQVDSVSLQPPPTPYPLPPLLILSEDALYFSFTVLDVSSYPTWNRCSKSNSEKDSQRPAFLERNHTSIRRSSGSNGSAKHPYSNFNRSHRDRNREKDKDRSITGDLLDHYSSDPLENILTRSVESSLRRSQSLVSRRTGELLTHRTEDSRNCINNHQYSTNGILSGGGNLSSIQKATFDKDFPSLGNEDKQGGSGIGRVSSPVLSTAVQSLPVFNSGLLGGEKWTSALVEVPSIIGSTTIGSSSAQQSAVATPSSGALSAMAGLNMAEALSQSPQHARAIPQVIFLPFSNIINFCFTKCS